VTNLGDYELGLTDFEMYYTLADVNSTNNKFYYDNEEIVIPERPYKLRNIERYLKREILHSHNAKRKENEELPLVIRVNNNIMRSKIKCVYWINFTKPCNIVGSLLRFHQQIFRRKRKIGMKAQSRKITRYSHTDVCIVDLQGFLKKRFIIKEVQQC